MDKSILPDGYGTFIMAIATLLSMTLARYGFNVPIEEFDEFIVGGMMIWMRMRTSTAPGDKLNLLNKT